MILNYKRLIGIILTFILFFSPILILSMLDGNNSTNYKSMTLNLSDDNYENNDDIDHAHNISSWPGTFFSCNQSDDDYFEIYVPSGFEDLEINLYFIDSSGNIDVQLLNVLGEWVAESDTLTDNEQITKVVPSAGTYYIRVFGVNSGNLYNLIWEIGIPNISPPSLISPANGTITSNNSQNLNWTVVPEATNYDLQIDTTPNLTPTGAPDYITSDANYSFSSLSDGTYYWRVRSTKMSSGWISTYSPIWTFTVDTLPPDSPLPQSPVHDATTGDTPELTWSLPSGNPSIYHLQLSPVSNFTILSVNITTTNNNYTPDPLGDGKWYWQVRAGDEAGNWGPWSISERWFWVDTTGPDAPQHISPIDGAYINSNPVYLDWESSPDAVSYQMDLNGELYNTSNTDRTVIATQQTYTWKLRAIDSLGNWGSWSSTWNFTLDTTPPDAPLMYTPTNGSLTNSSTPTFTWQTLTQIDQYQIQLANDKEFSQLILDVNVSQSTYIYAGTPLIDKDYYWRLRAHDLAGNPSSWGINWTFSIDTQIPDPVTIVWPQHGQEINTTNTVFCDWLGDTDAMEFHIQIDDADDFSSPLLNMIMIEGPYTTNAFLDGIYYIRIRCVDCAGNIGSWSDTHSFTIDYVTDPPGGGPDGIPGFEMLFILGTLLGIVVIKIRKFKIRE